MTDTADLLAGVPLLSGLDRKQLANLARDFTERTFPAGSVVVRQGDEKGIGFFVVAELPLGRALFAWWAIPADASTSARIREQPPHNAGRRSWSRSTSTT